MIKATSADAHRRARPRSRCQVPGLRALELVASAGSRSRLSLHPGKGERRGIMGVMAPPELGICLIVVIELELVLAESRLRDPSLSRRLNLPLHSASP
ncbi:hypothetical protein EVAR_14996_1 [Eumeta japonica]|uniref:Uncharacterized protein n=1 Tax=Eumeta variegata TaxID=151549 RepID=A0A4C1X9Q6_EUMVA|nr:hypothetical protein EVAR_14996_1 [Eumeta japonica]